VIGLDSNVLIRYITRDDAAQAERARRLLQEECSAENPGFVSSAAVCELVWVLARVYRYDREPILVVVERLLALSEIEFEDRHLVEQSLLVCRTSRADFADMLIGLKNRYLGCATTATFDKTAAKLPHFRAL
jgi:predicted nucleic-acid-binding protein